jgi:hypothetical protein
MTQTKLLPEFLNALSDPTDSYVLMGVNVPIPLASLRVLNQPEIKWTNTSMPGYFWPSGEPMGLDFFLYLHGYLFSEAIRNEDDSVAFFYSRRTYYRIRYKLSTEEEYRSIDAEIVLLMAEDRTLDSLLLITDVGFQEPVLYDTLEALVLPRGETWRKNV